MVGNGVVPLIPLLITESDTDSIRQVKFWIPMIQEATVTEESDIANGDGVGTTGACDFSIFTTAHGEEECAGA